MTGELGIGEAERERACRMASPFIVLEACSAGTAGERIAWQDLSLATPSFSPVNNNSRSMLDPESAR